MLQKILLSVILGLMFLSFACNHKPDVNQFITKENYNKVAMSCMDSNDINCRRRPYEIKVKKYCSENKLSDDKCQDIMNDVTLVLVKYQKEEAQMLKDLNEKIKQATRK